MRYEILKYERIRNLRIDKGWTQEYVANILNIKQNSYSQYELGERNIPIEAFIKLSRLYETSIDYLVGETNIKEPFPKNKPM